MNVSCHYNLPTVWQNVSGKIFFVFFFFFFCFWLKFYLCLYWLVYWKCMYVFGFILVFILRLFCFPVSAIWGRMWNPECHVTISIENKFQAEKPKWLKKTYEKREWNQTKTKCNNINNKKKKKQESMNAATTEIMFVDFHSTKQGKTMFLLLHNNSRDQD